jgi:hypothetical protein
MSGIKLLEKKILHIPNHVECLERSAYSSFSMTTHPSAFAFFYSAGNKLNPRPQEKVRAERGVKMQNLQELIVQIYWRHASNPSAHQC